MKGTQESFSNEWEDIVLLQGRSGIQTKEEPKTWGASRRPAYWAPVLICLCGGYATQCQHQSLPCASRAFSCHFPYCKKALFPFLKSGFVVPEHFWCAVITHTEICWQAIESLMQNRNTGSKPGRFPGIHSHHHLCPPTASFWTYIHTIWATIHFDPVISWQILHIDAFFSNQLPSD